jgi:hypothetical protein
MRNRIQFRVRMRIINQLMCRFANRQLWPLAVTVLRTGLITTTGHPFQGYGGILCENIGVSLLRYPAGYRRFGVNGGPKCTA